MVTAVREQRWTRPWCRDPDQVAVSIWPSRSRSARGERRRATPGPATLIGAEVIVMAESLQVGVGRGRDRAHRTGLRSMTVGKRDDARHRGARGRRLRLCSVGRRARFAERTGGLRRSRRTGHEPMDDEPRVETRRHGSWSASGSRRPLAAWRYADDRAADPSGGALMSEGTVEIASARDKAWAVPHGSRPRSASCGPGVESIDVIDETHSSGQSQGRGRLHQGVLRDQHGE